MKKNLTRLSTILFSFMAAIIFESCATLDAMECPYIIDNLKTELGEKNETCKYAGTYFSFFNDSDKVVKEFSVSFMIYENGENPFLGSNKITSTAVIDIPPHEAADISISLDKFISVVPDYPYEVDYFYVKEIIYDDDSKWEDYFGTFARSVNNDTNE